MQVRGEKDYISLAKGLITERSPIVGEEQACKDELNFLFDSGTGARVRRKGLEAVRTYTNVFPGVAKFERRHHWEEQNLFVDLTRTLDFTFLGIALVNNFRPYNLRIQAEIPIVGGGNNIISISSNSSYCLIGAAGKLFVLQAISSTRYDLYEVDIFVRDFTLIDDGLSVQERPSTLTDAHKYNLLNAGWYAPRRGSDAVLADPINLFFGATPSEYPSNADIAQLGLKADSEGREIFSKATLVDTVVGSTEAPRGHYVYNLQNFRRLDRVNSPGQDGTVSSSVRFIRTLTL
jgi:hypothetical protein